MHPFSTPWKHQETVQFSQSKDALGTNGLRSIHGWSLINLKNVQLQGLSEAVSKSTKNAEAATEDVL